MSDPQIPKPEAVLTTWERIKFGFAANRRVIGAGVALLALVFRFALHFEGHSDFADGLKTLADALLVGAAATASAGQFKSDDYHEERKQEIIRSRSGRFEAVQEPRPTLAQKAAQRSTSIEDVLPKTQEEAQHGGTETSSGVNTPDPFEPTRGGALNPHDSTRDPRRKR